MTHRFASPRIACLLLGLCLGLTACGIGQRSPETRYYVLALPSGSGHTAGARTVTGPHVGIGPVTLPAYLDRQQIFIRQGEATDVKLAEYDRWGENLSEGIVRLLVETVSARLASTGGAALPLRAASPTDRRIGVNINRFDGAPGSEVVLDADWGLYTPQGDVLKEGHFLGKAPAGTDIDGLVRAHGELLSQFGAVLAEAVRSTPTKTSIKTSTRR